jgi:uncharacterized protein (TIGR02284 family)
MMNIQETNDKLNELLRGERSAVETYQQAFEKVGDDPRADELHAVAADHRHAVQMLAERVVAGGGEPAKDSGALGTWNKTVMGTAKIFGDKASLGALRLNEERGKKVYQDILLEKLMDPVCRDLIQNQLLPKQISHIHTLDRLIETLN